MRQGAPAFRSRFATRIQACALFSTALMGAFAWWMLALLVLALLGSASGAVSPLVDGAVAAAGGALVGLALTIDRRRRVLTTPPPRFGLPGLRSTSLALQRLVGLERPLQLELIGYTPDGRPIVLDRHAVLWRRSSEAKS
jgi:hypothetical protein